MTEKTSLWQVILTKKMLTCILIGFSSGLPLFILFNLVPAWLRSEHINLKTIGLFALIQLPYTWKFIWSPFFDRYAPHLGLTGFGRRRGWLVIWQLLLIVALACIGFFDPTLNIKTIAALCAITAFFSASQDIVIDAFRRELLISEQELEMGNGIFVSAYRISSLIPGSLALILADHLNWQSVFIITASFMLMGIATTFSIKEPVLKNSPPQTLKQAILVPFKDFIQRSGWLSAFTILAFIFLYKLGDSMATALATPFYLDMHFSKTEIGLIAKNAGLWPSIFGGILGGIWATKLGLNRALWLFGAVQMISILGFAWLAHTLQDATAFESFIEFSIFNKAYILKLRYLWLALIIGLEALGVGLGTAAFVTYISRNTNPIYAATQFALFTSLAAVPRTVGNASVGCLVESGNFSIFGLQLHCLGLGWYHFFILCFFLAIPGMLLLFKIAPWHGVHKSLF